MPKSTGKAGIGVLLRLGDDASPVVFATVSNVTQLSAGGVTLATEDATQLGSPNFYAEFIPTLKTADEWTFTLQWDPTDPTHDGTTGLRKVLEDRAERQFRMDASALGIAQGIEVDGYVTALGNLEVTPTGIITQSCTIRPTGAPRSVATP